MIVTALTGFILTTLCCGAETPKAMTLELGEAMDLVLKNNPAVKQADEAVNASRARLSQRKSGYYPLLDAEFKYAHLDPDPSIVFGTLGTVQLFPVDNYDAHLNLSYNLIDFGKTSNNAHIAGFGLTSAANNAGLVKNNLAFQMIQGFYAILVLKESVNVQDQQLKTLDEHLNLTKKKLDAGTGTQFDILTIQVKVEESKSKKIDVENNLNKQIIAFKKLLGLPNDSQLDMKGDFNPKPEDVNEDALIEKALSERLELKMARDRQASAGLALKVARSDNYPSVNLDFMWGTKNGYFPDMSERLTNTVAAAQVSMPIFNGFHTLGQINEAKANLESSSSQAKDTTDSVISEVRQAVSDLRASMERMKSAELNVQLANEALAQAKIRFESGVITNLDMLNAETSLSEAKLLNLQVIYSYIISRENLKKAIGAKLWQKEM